MRVQMAEILLACCLSPVAVPDTTACAEPRSSPSERAFAYFMGLPADDTKTVLDIVRSEPLDAASKAQVLSQLPREGELQLNADEAAKLESVVQVLVYHERYRIVDIKVIDVPQGVIGLHARSVLLVSRQALRLLSAPEVQALAAHEMGHEYFWDDYEHARDQHDIPALQEIELKCDGIAAITLKGLGLDPFTLLTAVRKLTYFNEARAATADAANYPEIAERARFLKKILTWWSHRVMDTVQQRTH
jgi:hypothetical protein